MASLQDLCGEWTSFILLVGLFSAFRILRDVLGIIVDGVRAYILPVVLGPVDPVKIYGRWALITGCTGGIGREYALGLASKGMDVVLVSRSRSKLDQLDKEIKEKFGVNTFIIEADFTRVEVLADIINKVEDMEIGVLVNNVGINGGGQMPFLDMDRKNVVDLITVNITAATVLCHGLIPPMVKRGRGAVVNISSIGGLMQGPYFAEYVASKHYIHAFTEAITEEYKNTGVFIQEINPGLVETAMTEDFKDEFSGTLIMPTAGRFVKWALASLGWTNQTCGYWFHSFQLPFFTGIPIWLTAKMQKQAYETAKLKNK